MKKKPFKRLATQAAHSSKWLKMTAESLAEAAAPRVKDLAENLNQKAHVAQTRTLQLWRLTSAAGQVFARDLSQQTRKAATQAVKKASSKVNETVSREVVERFKQSTRGAISSLKKSGAEFKAYLESDEFELDLDDLARRLGKFEGTYENFEGPVQKNRAENARPASKKARLLRVHAKSRFLFKECREDILKQASRKEVIFALPINPKLAAALALIFSGVKTTEIVLHGIEVFAPKKRPAKVIRIK